MNKKEIDWEKGKGLVNFSYKPFDYNLKNCTLYIALTGNELQPNVTNTNPTNNETNTFQNVFVNIGIYEWNVLCYDTYNNSAFAENNHTLNISSPDLVVTSNDIWFEYTNLIEGATIDVYANITNEGLSPAEEPFQVRFYLGDPQNGGIH